ncbi:MAG TPA: cytochrome c [Casimicrobiaceae bacterium]|nr:cytochrome c [Casimicrobiaceae bacterium]
MTIRRLFASLVALAVSAAAVIATGAADTPGGTIFDRRVVAQGRQLAFLGNCNTCHTAGDGVTFAGGRAIPTLFGTIYSTNITPDPDTGIGKWSVADFRRAMHEGVAPDGRHLYPVFPYDHFTHVADDDVDAIYVYLMTREPVRATAPANQLRMPFGARPLLGIWKVLYLHRGPIAPDQARSAQWNRGRYLVDGLAHCGACHTPRNGMGAEQSGRDLSGGEAEGWHAPAIDESSRAPLAWTADALTRYLRSGYDEHHGASRGPMAPVAANLAEVDEADVRAIAEYIASRAGRSSVGTSVAVSRAQIDAAPSDSDGHDDAALLYEGACASCHDRTQRGVHLEFSTAVTDVVPTNIIRVITDGLAPVEGEPSRSMPGFRGAFTAAQTAALVRYIRARYSRAEPWRDVESEVDRIRAERPQRSAS